MRARTHLGPCLGHRGLRTMALRTHPSSSHTTLVRQHSNGRIRDVVCAWRACCKCCLWWTVLQACEAVSLHISFCRALSSAASVWLGHLMCRALHHRN